LTAIDDVLPSYDVHLVHSIAYTRSVDDALATPVAADPFVRLLFRLRGLPVDGTIGDLFVRMHFDELARSKNEVVFGGAGTPWRPRAGIGSFADVRPGTVRVAANFLSDGAVLSTETRIQAVDDAARRAFARYWRLVGPFSGVIRRRWLKHIAAG
jgi:hypothetical protein